MNDSDSGIEVDSAEKLEVEVAYSEEVMISLDENSSDELVGSADEVKSVRVAARRELVRCSF